MIIDTFSMGYKYYSASSRKTHTGLQWLGTVALKNDTGSLALNTHTGNYIMLRHGAKPLELDAMEVLEALADPQVINRPGRKADPHGSSKARGLTLTDAVVNAARILGEDNISRGIRLCVEFATTRENEFMLWVADRR